MSYCELMERIFAFHGAPSREAAIALVEESFEQGHIDARERKLLLGAI